VAPAIVLILPVNWLIFARLVPAHLTQQAGAEQPLNLGPLLRFGAGNFVSSLFFVIYNTLLPILVSNQSGATATAYFYLPWTIASSIQLIGLSLASSLVVEAALDQARLREYTGRILKTSFALLTPVAAVFLLGARLILQIYGAAYAAEGAWLLVLLVAAAFPGTLIAVAVGLMRAQNHNRQLVFSQGLLCALALGLSAALLPRAGINGVGAAWLIAQAVVAAYLLPVEFWPLFRHPLPQVSAPLAAQRPGE
jgi:O-antigen/teichoic acid export membrane protein